MAAPTAALRDQVRFNAEGLVPAVVQDARTGRVQMLAWMNADALDQTLATGRVTFFSRSRGALWVKGESSGNFLRVASVHVDCDEDTLLVLAIPEGPSCHTGAATCFFRRIFREGDDDEGGADGRTSVAEPTLDALAREIESRRTSDGARSYTRSLLDAGAPKIGEKLREEADELARAVDHESGERVASEAADVVYHLMVGLALRGVDLRQVLAALDARRGVSGHDEKRNRRAPAGT